MAKAKTRQTKTAKAPVKAKKAELVNEYGCIARPYENSAQAWLDKGWQRVSKSAASADP